MTHNFCATGMATFITTDRDGMEWNSCEQLPAFTFTASSLENANYFAHKYYSQLLTGRSYEGIDIDVQYT